jgi:hypothetical protein
MWLLGALPFVDYSATELVPGSVSRWSSVLAFFCTRTGVPLRLTRAGKKCVSLKGDKINDGISKLVRFTKPQSCPCLSGLAFIDKCQELSEVDAHCVPEFLDLCSRRKDPASGSDDLLDALVN